MKELNGNPRKNATYDHRKYVKLFFFLLQVQFCNFCVLLDNFNDFLLKIVSLIIRFWKNNVGTFRKPANIRKIILIEAICKVTYFFRVLTQFLYFSKSQQWKLKMIFFEIFIWVCERQKLSKNHFFIFNWIQRSRDIQENKFRVKLSENHSPKKSKANLVLNCLKSECRRSCGTSRKRKGSSLLHNDRLRFLQRSKPKRKRTNFV